MHNETVTHTKRLDQIERKTDDIAKKLKVIELQNSIIHLDKEWEKYRNSVMTADNNGQLFEPTEAGAFTKGIVGFVVGVLWAIGCLSGGQPALALVGVGFFVIAFIWMKNDLASAESFNVQKLRYETVRKSIQHSIEGEQEN